ncbi:hypothetical protein L6452_14765 [Arctium lappa]|uniref:Uncharacterized protein n=1 Tax=Arctium lappa TaxID=4217 RepID=A0ACB9CM74_ARCLA|nr:hypothetical protein L6452_14765 [Arctium lappa]
MKGRRIPRRRTLILISYSNEPSSGLLGNPNLRPHLNSQGNLMVQGRSDGPSVVKLGDNSDMGLKSKNTSIVNTGGDDRGADGNKELQNQRLKKMTMEGEKGESNQKEDHCIKSHSGSVVKSKKKGDSNVFGRGRVSFHYLKQLARSNCQSKGGRKSPGRITESRRQERLESIKSGASTQNHTTVLNDINSTDASMGLEEFGEKIGVQWGN